MPHDPKRRFSSQFLNQPQPPQTLSNPLYHAIQENNPTLVDSLCKTTKPHLLRNSPFVYAILQNRLEIGEILLSHGIKPTGCFLKSPIDLNPHTGFSAAFASSAPDVWVRLLCRHKVPLETVMPMYSTTPLLYAITMNLADVVRLLLDHGAEVGSPGASTGRRLPITAAAANGDLEILRMIVDAGANVNAIEDDEYGRTALAVAVERCNIACVKLLLDVGANVDLAVFAGTSPLHIAANRECVGVMQALVEAGADVNSKTVDGETPLYSAVDSSRAEEVVTEGVLYLLSCGAKVDEAKTDGSTALTIALKRNFLKIAQILTNAGLGNVSELEVVSDNCAIRNIA
ncbi:hypothetical protein HK096_010573 [Nowakowskiella sp. JEL0078]|nr:hypothetical protein HK096_010573 [Nowakowskiella sp. JEL0078]